MPTKSFEPNQEDFREVFYTTDDELKVIGNLRQQIISFYSEPRIMGDITEIDADTIVVRYFNDDIDLLMKINRRKLTWDFLD